MTSLYGFEFVREATIAELNTRARLWRHGATGAELLSLENDDENKVFGITFRTPPADSTGLPHILEHVVLAGSERFPLKDPFFEMVKGSLATFINAMTFPDKTVYPAASTNLQDFYNLLDVYADAVFRPLMTPEKLAQEGWHYELADAGGPLTFKGVVFNEMKGAYSSPDSLLDRTSRRTLFPDNAYGHDSGGDPAAIPDLTYEQFRRFYETYYHPSNALIFFYGDDDPEERLRRMSGYLAPYAPVETGFLLRNPVSSVSLQPPFAAPRLVRQPYSVAEDEDLRGSGKPLRSKSFVEVNWLLPEYEDTALMMALSVLSHALLESPASPLRKALLDSGLGEDVIGGFSTGTRQTTFSAGLKGVSLETGFLGRNPVSNVERVEPFILETLAGLATDGFDPEMIAAAVNTIEFRLRENNTGRYPRGLALLMRALSTWLHGRDPLAPLAFEAPLAAFKATLAANPGYPGDLIREHLLNNPHRVTVILEPDATLARRQEAAERARLDAAHAAMSAADVAAVMAQAAELKRRQELPDPPEVVATLPTLRRADLESRHKPIPLAVDEVAGARVLSHDLFTNGIVYLDLALDLAALPEELLPYALLFGRALLEMGTETEDYVRLSQRIGRTTGGIYPTALIAPVRREEETADFADYADSKKLTPRREGSKERQEESSLAPVAPFAPWREPLQSAKSAVTSSATYLVLRGKATVAQGAALLGIMGDVLGGVRLDNRERFRQLVLEAKAGAEAHLAPAGHVLANTRLRAHFHPAFHVEELVNGVSQLLFLRRLAERVENDWPGVLADLEVVRTALLRREGLVANVTLDEANYAGFAPRLGELVAGLPASATVARVDYPRLPPSPPMSAAEDAGSQPALLGDSYPPREGLSIPAQVNYVGKGVDLRGLGRPLRSGAIAAVNNLLRTDYLLQKIRIQGGAYGAFASFNVNAGVLTFLSYRDPNLSATLRAYDAVAGFLRGLSLDDAALTPAIIGAVGTIDAYQLPDAKGYTSLQRHLTNESDAYLQAFRDELLGTTLDDFHRLGEALAGFGAAGEVVVLGGAEALERANEEGLGLDITRVM